MTIERDKSANSSDVNTSQIYMDKAKANSITDCNSTDVTTIISIIGAADIRITGDVS